jgi:DMSO/TMAO reductase YedYZ molybdopterin-dependent catalytic subunit
MLLVGCAIDAVSGEAELTPCVPPPIAVPTLPAEIPDYLELDPATGLHVTGRYQEIDLNSYRLVVTGTVEHSLSLTYDELRCLPKVEVSSSLVCPGFFEDQGTWAGVPITHVLELAGAQPDAIGLRLVSADGYDALATINMVESQGAFLAYEWGREPLPILHGFPVRAVFPGSSGSVWVKWLVEIEVH